MVRSSSAGFDEFKGEWYEYRRGYRGGRIELQGLDRFHWDPIVDGLEEHEGFKQEALFDYFAAEGRACFEYDSRYDSGQDPTEAKLVFDDANVPGRYDMGTIADYLQNGARAGFTWYWQTVGFTEEPWLQDHEGKEFTERLYADSVDPETDPEVHRSLLESKGLKSDEAQALIRWLDDDVRILLNTSEFDRGRTPTGLSTNGVQDTSRKSPVELVTPALARGKPGKSSLQLGTYAHVRQVIIDLLVEDNTSIETNPLEVVADQEALKKALRNPTENRSRRASRVAAEAYVDSLSDGADVRRDKLAAAVRKRAGRFRGLPLPPSFVDFIARFGFSNIHSPVGDIDLHLLHVWYKFDYLKHRREPSEFLSFGGPVSRGADKIPQFGFSDCPRMVPGYEFIALLDVEGPIEGECIWLYRGWDTAFRGGIQLAPMGATFFDVALMSLTGLAQALYWPWPHDEGKEALAALSARGDRELLMTLLDRIELLIARTVALGITVNPSEYGDGIDYDEEEIDYDGSGIDYDEQVALLRPRIDAARAALR